MPFQLCACSTAAFRRDGELSRGALVTTSRCRLLKLFREDFHRLETANPDIAGLLREAAKKRRLQRGPDSA